MRRLLLAAIFLSAAAASGQPRPPLTRALADALYAKLAGGSTIGGTTTVNNLTINGTCTGCSSGSAPTTRLISTTSPLGGGGDLSADRTLTCTTCATSSNALSFFAASSILAAPFGSQGTTTTILHGNAGGVFSFGSVVDGDLSLTTPALGAPTATTIQTSGNAGVGAAPSVTAGEMIVGTDNFNGTTIVRSSNPDATDTGSIASLEAKASGVTLRLLAHGAGRTAIRLGVTLANFGELTSGLGLLLSTTSTNPIIAGTNSTRGLTIDGTSQAVSLRGTQTNDNATTGDTGEYQTGTVAANTTSLSTGTTANVGANTNITLAAGDWDCSGVVNFTFGATTSITNLTGGISTTTGTLPAQDSFFDFETSAIIPTGAAVATWVVPTVRLSNSGSTNVFLVSQATFTASTLKVGGTIRCRRMR